VARRTNANELVIISWRDIPAQVNGGAGETKRQEILSHRFQKAIDRAAMVADKKTASEYVQEWRRSTVALPADFDGDYSAAAQAEAARIEEEFTTARLKLWVATGGWNPDRPLEERI
jgi:hypothetical protein